MKKLIILVLMATLATFSLAADKVGVVDGQKIFATFSLTQTYRKNLEVQRAKFQADIKSKEVLLQKQQVDIQAKGVTATDAERKKFEADVAAFRKYAQETELRIQKEEQARGQQINAMIQTSVKKIAKNGAYDLVMEAQALLFGGEDITDKVLADMEIAAKNMK
ncbi:MAG: OmpH family outer membrane protein [Fusobacteriaceae bacterium]